MTDLFYAAGRVDIRGHHLEQCRDEGDAVETGDSASVVGFRAGESAQERLQRRQLARKATRDGAVTVTTLALQAAP